MILQNLTRFATAVGVTLQHPTGTADLLDRKAHAVQIRSGKLSPIGDVLADLEPAKWPKAIKDQAVASAEATIREQAFRSLPATIDKRVEHAIRADLDNYLNQFDQVLIDAETDLVGGAHHLTLAQLDPAIAVRDHRGNHLSQFDTACTILTAYGDLLAQLIPKHSDGSPTIPAGAYSQPPETPTERRTVVDVAMTQRTLTAPDDMRLINNARQMLQGVTSHQRRRDTLHTIANDDAYTIRAARTVDNYLTQSAAWKALNRIDIVERFTEDRYSLPTIKTM